jgi:hypothetical protein
MRDINILKSYKREINLRKKIIPSKKVYTRKVKYKRKILD